MIIIFIIMIIIMIFFIIIIVIITLAITQPLAGQCAFFRPITCGNLAHK